MSDESRPLRYRELIEHFLKTTLGLPIHEKAYRTIISKILQAEMNLASYPEDSLNNEDVRVMEFRNEDVRWKLRNKIRDELFLKGTPDKSDNKIKLGYGGCRPKNKLNSDRQAYIIIGPPASGKSKIASVISEKYGAMILDSDFAKRKLPEYKDFANGASIVHKESAFIVFGAPQPFKDLEFESVYQKCIDNEFNIVIPKIGHDHTSIIKFADAIKDDGYDIHLILVHVDRKESTKRAINRYIATNRYVPLGQVFDEYGNQPVLSYYRIKNALGDTFKSIGKLNNETQRGEPPKFVEASDISNPVNIFKT